MVLAPLLPLATHRGGADEPTTTVSPECTRFGDPRVLLPNSKASTRCRVDGEHACGGLTELQRRRNGPHNTVWIGKRRRAIVVLPTTTHARRGHIRAHADSCDAQAPPIVVGRVFLRVSQRWRPVAGFDDDDEPPTLRRKSSLAEDTCTRGGIPRRARDTRQGRGVAHRQDPCRRPTHWSVVAHAIPASVTKRPADLRWHAERRSRRQGSYTQVRVKQPARKPRWLAWDRQLLLRSRGMDVCPGLLGGKRMS
jgi:hypothetical protein